jgi:hypothetical protein
MAGGASGTIVTNPLWVIKTRFMVSEDMAVLACILEVRAVRLHQIPARHNHLSLAVHLIGIR